MPAVFATPMMILENELTSGDAINAYLNGLDHGPAPRSISASSRLSGRRGDTNHRAVNFAVAARGIRFEVEAIPTGRTPDRRGPSARGLSLAPFNNRFGTGSYFLQSFSGGSRGDQPSSAAPCNAVRSHHSTSRSARGRGPPGEVTFGAASRRGPSDRTQHSPEPATVSRARRSQILGHPASTRARQFFASRKMSAGPEPETGGHGRHHILRHRPLHRSGARNSASAMPRWRAADMACRQPANR